MLEENYLLELIGQLPINLIEEDKKINYIIRKIDYRGYDAINLSEINYIRNKLNLPELDINNLKDCLYNNMISYRDIRNATGISRSMMCMILRGTRNSTIKQINKVITYLKEQNIEFIWR